MKKVTIEQLLSWAFTHELGKVGAGGGGSFVSGSAWSAVSEMAALGTLVDRSPNHYGVIPDFVVTSYPHEDAVMAGDAVRALADRGGYEISEQWYPFPEWDDPHGLVREEVARTVNDVMSRRDVVNGKHVANLVISRAVLGRSIDWTAEEPTYLPVLKLGNPQWFVKRRITNAMNRVEMIEDDGFDRKRRRPKRGAYQKFYIDGSIRGAIIARMEWQIVQEAFEALHSELSGRLKAHDLLPFTPNLTPWERGRFLENAPVSH